MKVSNMTNEKGRPVANQFILFTPEATYFKSYDAVVVKTVNAPGGRRVTLDVNFWDLSKTTRKYRNLFLGETAEVTRKKVESGEYELADLNEEEL